MEHDYEAHTRPPHPPQPWEEFRPSFDITPRYLPLIAIAAVAAGILISYFFPLGFAAP